MKKLILLSIVSLSALISSAQCSADFTWSASGNTVYLTNTSIGTNNNDWSFGNGGSSSATNPTYTYSSPGIYTICLYSYYMDSIGGFCDDSVCYQVTVLDSMVTGCTVGASIYGSGNQIIGSNSSMNAGIYTWTVSDYNSGASLTNVNTTDLNYSPGYYGDFLVCLTAYDSTGMVCDTICDIITLSDSLDSTANVISISINEFQLYPNPTNTVLNMRFDHLPSNAHARLVDLLGREMFEVDITTQITEIQVIDFPSGIYFVQLIDANNQIMGMHKFVRE